MISIVRDLAETEPSALAVECAGTSTDRGSLWGSANQVASMLSAAPQGSVVGIHAEPGVELVCMLLGCALSGRPYYLVDPRNAPPRLDDMLFGAGVEWVLTSSEGHEGLASRDFQRISKAGEIVLHGRVLRRGRSHTSSEDAYIVFTSGSTGSPKAIAIPWSLLSLQVRWFCEAAKLVEGDRISVVTPLAFDPVMIEIWASLVAGAVAVIGPRSLTFDAFSLGEWLFANAVNVAIAPTRVGSQFLQQLDGEPGPVRAMFLGGERLTADLRGAAGHMAVWNCYGPAECGPVTFAARIDPGADVNPLRPIAGVSARTRPVEDGDLELEIGSPSRGRYIGDQSSQPWSIDESGLHWYATGDLVRIVGTGFEFFGRVDEMIKVAGVRIEPAELEAAAQVTGLATELAAFGIEINEEHLLAAAFVPTSQCSSELSLREALEAVLPGTMVPSVLAMVDKMPLLSSGKRDLVELRAVTIAQANGIQRSVVRRVIADAVDAGTLDPSLLSGLSSLEVFRLAAQLSSATGRICSPRNLRRARTVADIVNSFCDDAERITSERLGRSASETTRMSVGQESLWILEELLGPQQCYTFGASISVGSEHSLDAVRTALEDTINAHDVYRTRVEVNRGVPTLRRGSWAPQITRVSTASGLPYGELVSRFLHEPFRRGEALARWLIIEDTLMPPRILLCEHHLVHDGESARMFVEEFAERLAGRTPASSTSSFFDFCEWQSTWLYSPLARQMTQSWTDYLQGALPAMSIPIWSGTKSGVGGRVTKDVPDDICLKLKVAAANQGYTPFEVLLGAFAAAIHDATGLTDIVVGSAFANRRVRGTERILGFLTHMLPLRLTVNGKADGDWFAAAAAAVEFGWNNQEIPPAVIVAAMPTLRTGTEPVSSLFEVGFSAQERPASTDAALKSGVAVEGRLDDGTAKFGLNVTAFMGNHLDPRISIVWEWDQGRCEDVVVTKLIQGMNRRLRSLVEGRLQSETAAAEGTRNP